MESTNTGGIAIGGISSLALGDEPAAPARAPEQMKRPVRAPKPADRYGWWWGTGRRKTAVARLRMKPTTGESTFVVERPDKVRKNVEEFFAELRDREDCLSPLKVTGLIGKFDIVASVHGGGFMGQAQSIRLALARALRDYDPTTEEVLREHGMLTRDAREVERKKYGQAGARRRFQFSKR